MPVPARRFTRVVVDYGHGGRDSATGKYLTPAGKQYTFEDCNPPLFIGEGISNRETAWRLMGMLLGLGVEVWDALSGKRVETSPNFDDLVQPDVPLDKRVQVARVLGLASDTLFLSIHSNAVGATLKGKSQSARGATFYTSPGQTASDGVATSIHDAFKLAFEGKGVTVQRGDLADGDPDKEADFYVLRRTPCPAVLGEVLFFTNIDDARFLLSPEGQTTIARAYLSGIADWLKPTAPSPLPV